MDNELSRSAVKRQYKQVEHLAQELVDLTGKNLKALPCDDALREEIRNAQSLKGGARKRQIKYLAKLLRQDGPIAELLDFLEDRKGSHLKETGEFKELERLRDGIISTALLQAENAGGVKDASDGSKWASIVAAVSVFPSLEVDVVIKSAREYVRTRNPKSQREIFRLLKAAQDRQRFEDARKKEGENGV